MIPLWKQEQRLDHLESADQRTCLLEWLVIGVGLVGMAAVTAVSLWLW